MPKFSVLNSRIEQYDVGHRQSLIQSNCALVTSLTTNLLPSIDENRVSIDPRTTWPDGSARHSWQAKCWNTSSSQNFVNFIEYPNFSHQNRQNTSKSWLKLHLNAAGYGVFGPTSRATWPTCWQVHSLTKAWLGCFDQIFLWENAISERVVLRSKWESVSLEIFLHIYRGFSVAVVQITNYFSLRLHLDALQLCLWNCTNQCISTAEIHSDELVGFQSNFRHYFAALQACSFAYICRIIKLFGKRCKKASMPLDDRSIRVRKEPR